MFRIVLFLATNAAVLLLASIVFSVFGLDQYSVDGRSLNLQSLLIFSALFGMGGSFVSLLLSKWMAKRSTGAKVIDQPGNQTEQWLLSTVRQLAERAGIAMPEVAIFPAEQPNAFATGASKDKALVAVSSGLLQNMNAGEVEAVLGHEIGHVANGDMLTLTLIQGVMNTFVLFFARIIGFFVDRVLLKNDRGFGIGYFVTVIVAQIALTFLAAIVVNWFSRYREFRADKAGAELAGRNKMISALERLKIATQQPEAMPDTLVAFGITDGIKSGIQKLFSTHPPLDARIAALRQTA